MSGNDWKEASSHLYY